MAKTCIVLELHYTNVLPRLLLILTQNCFSFGILAPILHLRHFGLVSPREWILNVNHARNIVFFYGVKGNRANGLTTVYTLSHNKVLVQFFDIRSVLIQCKWCCVCVVKLHFIRRKKKKTPKIRSNQDV